MKYMRLIIVITFISSCVSENEISVRNNKNEVIAIYNTVPTNIGTALPDNIIGRVIMAKPKNACKRIKPPPSYFNEIDYQWIVIIR